MSRRLFRLFDDVYFPERWHLGSPIDVQGKELDDFGYFTRGQAVKTTGPIRIPFDVPGRPLDFSLAGVLTPVAHARVAEVFTRLVPQDVQLLPAELQDQSEPYFILVATRRIRCIDERASKIERWEPEDGIPEMVGRYRSVDDMHIDKSRVGDAQVFRPEGWESFLIISEDLKNALEHSQATGLKFTEVP